MFTLLGDASPATVASSILAFESKIAEFTLPLDELRDPEKIYNKFNITTIQSLTDLHWISFFNGSGIPYSTLDANVQVPNFMVKLSQLIAGTSVADLQNYLKWRLLTTTSPKLSSAFANETFRFFSGVLSGQKVPSPRWKTCTSYTDSLLGDILGRYFVQRAFNGESLNITQKLIKLIETAFGDRLPSIDWMDDQTRAAAQVKLSQVVDLVGYPSKWADYSSVAISPVKFYDNTYNLQQFGWSGLIKVLTGPVDKTRWQMTPPTVNAYYDPSYNTINFPGMSLTVCSIHELAVYDMTWCMLYDGIINSWYHSTNVLLCVISNGNELWWHWYGNGS
jgi:putative endopeptidase